MKRLGTWLGSRAPEILAIVLPLLYCAFFLAPARHLAPDRALLGLTHPDQSVYYALAREAFENGNGLTYASPYSNLPGSPRIYSHFSFLLIGYFWKLTGLSLPALDYLLRALFGMATMLLVVRLFRAALPKNAPVAFGAAGAILLGGVAWLVGLLQYAQDTLLGAGAPNLEGYLRAFFQAESGYGEWYLNVFGNLAFVHELMFHVLFFGAALALVKGRQWLAIGLLFLTWWSHPYTGLQLGLVIFLYFLVEAFLAHHRSRSFGSLATVLAINLLFIGYYLVFLPRFAEHASVYEQMRRFSTPMLFAKLLPAYGVFLPLPLLYAIAPDFRRLLKESPAARLMLIWLAVTAALVFHDRILFFMKPFQPMHFTRGYLFVPLVFFSTCALGWLRGHVNWSGRQFAIALTLIFALQLPDNLLRAGLLRHNAAPMPFQYWIERKDLDLLQRIDAVRPPLTVHVVGDPSLERMIPLLTHHRAVEAHLYNTPLRGEKARRIEDFDRKLDRENLRALHVDALLLPAAALPRLRDLYGADAFDIAFEQAGMCLVLFHSTNR